MVTQVASSESLIWGVLHVAPQSPGPNLPPHMTDTTHPVVSNPPELKMASLHGPGLESETLGKLAFQGGGRCPDPGSSLHRIPVSSLIQPRRCFSVTYCKFRREGHLCMKPCAGGRGWPTECGDLLHKLLCPVGPWKGTLSPHL